ncbi:MAG: hypothetical protein RBT01_04065 [Anaerolineaceae bacterium]|jgi:hypothetical protein|nr:hypothetical protein [Anaerolineaceae bacterium]
MQIHSLIFWLISLISIWFSPFPQLDLVRIQSPAEGDYLQGNVAITGTVTGSGFQSAVISFRYQDTSSQSWFVIAQTSAPVVDDLIATWDTSTIADGVYQIRVLAVFDNGREQEEIITNLNVRNYTPIDPLKTADPGQPTQLNDQTPTILMEATSTLRPSPTSMPGNEMMVTQSQFINTAIQGAIFGVLFLIVIALFIIIRRRKMG